MDFSFTEDQTMMADTFRALLAECCTPADLRRLADGGTGRDPARWRRLVEMGLLSALVPEAAGGLGLQPVDFVLIAEAAGHAGLPEPLVETAGVALPVLASIEDDAARSLTTRTLTEGLAIALRHPANPFVADAEGAAAILDVTPEGIQLVDPATARLVAQPGADPLRRLTTVAARGEIFWRDPSAAARALDLGALFTAAQLVGIARRALDLAVAYAGERQQFGKPIGSYQAVKHLLATAEVRLAFARPLLHAAAALAPAHDAFARARISQAKIAAAEAADLACRTAVQVHGAMGYSWEVDVHFFLKRALALTHWWGGPLLHRRRIAERVFGAPLGPDLTFATEADHG